MSESFPIEKTFGSYTKEQGALYADHRPGYNSNVYNIIIDHHTSTGGKLDTLLDVGCGPGTATRELARYFAHATGIDASAGMIESAQLRQSSSGTPDPIRFEVASAEDLGSNLSPPIEEGSVDLITAARAAHWFDMTRFWRQAARMLKPGGTVAIWKSDSGRIHPDTPNAAKIQAVINDFEEREVRLFYEPGNWLAKSMYTALPLPWTLDPPIAQFDEMTFARKTQDDYQDPFLDATRSVDLDMMEKALSTASPIQRWREANPSAAGTENDLIRRMRREIESLLHNAGVEKGKEAVKIRSGIVLIMVKKKSYTNLQGLF